MTTCQIENRIKTENNYINWMEIVFGVSQGSILRPLLLNISLAGLFLIISNINIASYADDIRSYIAACSIEDLIRSLEEASTALFQWFDNSFLKNNLGKFHLLINK